MRKSQLARGRQAARTAWERDGFLPKSEVSAKFTCQQVWAGGCAGYSYMPGRATSCKANHRLSCTLSKTPGADAADGLACVFAGSARQSSLLRGGKAQREYLMGPLESTLRPSLKSAALRASCRRAGCSWQSCWAFGQLVSPTQRRPSRRDMVCLLGELVAQASHTGPVRPYSEPASPPRSRAEQCRGRDSYSDISLTASASGQQHAALLRTLGRLDQQVSRLLQACTASGSQEQAKGIESLSLPQITGERPGCSIGVLSWYSQVAPAKVHCRRLHLCTSSGLRSHHQAHILACCAGNMQPDKPVHSLDLEPAAAAAKGRVHKQPDRFIAGSAFSKRKRVQPHVPAAGAPQRSPAPAMRPPLLTACTCVLPACAPSDPDSMHTARLIGTVHRRPCAQRSSQAWGGPGLSSPSWRRASRTTPSLPGATSTHAAWAPGGST